MPPKKKVYSKKDPIDHVLLRPSMYVGSKTFKTCEEYIATFEDNEDGIDGEYNIHKKYITTSPAILRIFIEIISNAVDNVDRSRKAKIPCSTIKVNIDKETGETTVWNDGDIIPIEIHPEEKMYNHTMIFGHLLTGSNYDDTEEREISGLNGLGSKLTCIFSKKFTVKGLDPNNKKTFEQTWTNNMKNPSEPIIKNTTLKKGYTEVKYFPDFSQFDIDGYTDDIIGLYLKYVIDAAMLTKVKVYFNNDLINVNNLLSYSKLYDNSEERLYIKYENVEVVISPSTDFQHIGFTNGIYNKLGGQHIEAVCEALFRPLVEKFTKKDKPVLKISDIKQFFKVFVSCVVDKPEFDSQSKEKLESPKIKFEVKPADIKKLLKWSVIEDIEDMLKAKEMVVLKKSEKKKKGYVKIEGYDPANNAGGKNSHECGLILCEGLSAKTYAVAGIKKGIDEKSGRDWWGILPLSGKLLNCRNAAPTIIAKNKVITDLIQALGVKVETDYTDEKNFKTLNYGKVILLTDADVDGSHIGGLLLNFFHNLYPSLLNRDKSFILGMATPIVRVFNPKGDILFYDENKFKEFQAKQTKSFKSKYYKGLGTTKPEDVPDTFGAKMIEYTADEKIDDMMNKVFHKKYSDTRKEWLETYDPISKFSLDDQGAVVEMEISDFLNNEVIKFSHDDCKRSIPNLFDGMKQSQRKILYAVKKRKLTYNKQSLKVAQLGGYVAEHTNYHHGEQNLYDTIIKMAQEFPGSNNIPLLYRDGQFGTRLQGTSGKDAASPRYIFTKMESLTPLLFREEDDILLEYVIDDGDIVEPKFYIPILPVILMNGASGIGTGWSCSIPSYNPKDIIECVKIWLDNDGEIILDGDDNLSMIPDIFPWYRGFTGKIEKSDNKFISYGNIETQTGSKVKVTELPVGMWTDKFKEMCEDWLVDKQIKNMKNNSSYNTIDFTLTESDDGFNCNINNLKLYTYIHTTNMVLFNENEQIKKYTIEKIIDDFCKMRYSFYTKRKNFIINNLEKELKFMRNKARFIQEIIDKKLNIMNVEETALVKDLEDKGYDKDNNDDDNEDSIKTGYEYLLRMQVRTFTSNKVKLLKDDIKSTEKKLEIAKNTSEKQMWLKDIEEFEVEYAKWLKAMDNIDKKSLKTKSKK
jgi:DNA topoisomerase-2